MKTMNSLKNLVLGIGILLAAVACQEDPVEPIPEPNGEIDLSSLLSMKANLSGIKSNASGGASSQFAGGRLSGMRSAAARLQDDNGDGDTTNIWEPWETCAEITETENEDGSFTVVYDYGDGCYEGDEYWKIFMYGKFTDTYSWTERDASDNSYSGTSSGSTVYENFGSKFDDEEYAYEYELDGTSEYSSEYEDEWDDDEYSF